MDEKNKEDNYYNRSIKRRKADLENHSNNRVTAEDGKNKSNCFENRF